MDSFQLSSEQLRQYQSPGYVRFENALPQELLTRWRQIADELEAKARSEYDSGIQGKHYCIVEDPPGTRRTIYIELHPVAGNLESQRQSAYWADLRKQLMARVLAAHREPPIPAVWATHPVDHPEYPVPADLRDSAP